MATAEERKKLAAEQYLAENRVHWLLENVTADLINSAPTKPHPFIVKRIREIQENGAVAVHRRNIVAVLGGPASGKDTVCAYLARELGTVSVKAAELLRNEVKDGTAMGKRVGEMLHSNEVVPKEFVTELMRKRLEAFKASGKDARDEPGYVLEGFPRTMEQALHFESHGAEITKVIYLRASDAALLARMSRRGDDAGHEDEKTAEARAAKVREFKRSSLPVVEYYRALGKLVEVDAEAESAAVAGAVEAIVRK